MVEAARAAGSTRSRCLIDFGLPDDTVLASLHHLDELRRTANAGAAANATAVEASEAYAYA